VSVLKSTYAGKLVLVTGHTGFKGSWLSLWLRRLGARVIGLALEPPSEPSNFEASGLSDALEADLRVDVRDSAAILAVIRRIQPDFVFHLAAQALVKPSYEDPLLTMQVNAMGSANILQALREVQHPVVAVMITSDKCYDNVEWVWGYRETDRLGGQDPYSASKGMAELAIRSYVDSYLRVPNSPIRVGIVRAGNVIGGGDWARYRIVPDCMIAWSRGEEVEIRSPAATRPWQHVLEPLSGYLLLGSRLATASNFHGEAYNFGPPANQDFTVEQLIHEMEKHWDKIQWRDISDDQEHQHEAGLLRLNCDKAQFELSWEPTMCFEETVRMTVDWYKHYYQKPSYSMLDFTYRQIDNYMELGAIRNRVWMEQ